MSLLCLAVCDDDDGDGDKRLLMLLQTLAGM